MGSGEDDDDYKSKLSPVKQSAILSPENLMPLDKKVNHFSYVVLFGNDLDFNVLLLLEISLPI